MISEFVDFSQRSLQQFSGNLVQFKNNLLGEIIYIGNLKLFISENSQEFYDN